MLLNPVQVYFAAKYKTWEEFKNSPDHNSINKQTKKYRQMAVYVLRRNQVG